MGGGGDDAGSSCATDGSGNVYLAGYTQSITGTIIATVGSHQSTLGGSYDALLVKFKDCVPLTPLASVNGTVCAGANIQFSATVSGTATPSYSWAGPNTFSSAIQNPSIANAGTVHIGVYTLTVINNTVCVETTTTQLVSIISAPSLVAGTTNTSICPGQQAFLSVNGAFSYTWNNGSNLSIIAVSPTITTSYTVIGTAVDGCTNTAIVIQTVYPSPSITVNSGSICSGNSFTILPSGANTYTIQGGNAVVSPITNSTYSVTGTSSLGCLSASAAVSSVTVHALPVISVNSGTICSGQSFTINPSGASTYTYSSGNTVVSPTSNSTYSVTGTSSLGCLSASAAVSSVTVNALPIITVNSGAICIGQSFTISPIGANTYTIQGGNTIVSPTTNTSYTVVGSSTAGCVSNTFVTANVTVNALPNVNASSNSSFICVGQSATLSVSGAVNYTWSPAIPMNSVVSPSATITYTVIGEDANGCKNTAVITQSVDACTGIHNMASSASANVLVYPNPSTGIFNLETTTHIEIILTDVLSKVILNTKINSGTYQLNLNEQANGVYFLKTILNGQTKTIRLIKQ